MSDLIKKTVFGIFALVWFTPCCWFVHTLDRAHSFGELLVDLTFMIALSIALGLFLQVLFFWVYSAPEREPLAFPIPKV